MHTPPLGSIKTFWAHLLSLLKTLVKRIEGEKKITPDAEQCPVGLGLGLRAFRTLKPFASEICLTWGERQRDGDLSAAKRRQHKARKGRSRLWGNRRGSFSKNRQQH